MVHKAPPKLLQSKSGNRQLEISFPSPQLTLWWDGGLHQGLLDVTDHLSFHLSFACWSGFEILDQYLQPDELWGLSRMLLASSKCEAMTVSQIPLFWAKQCCLMWIYCRTRAPL